MITFTTPKTFFILKKKKNLAVECISIIIVLAFCVYTPIMGLLLLTILTKFNHKEIAS